MKADDPLGLVNQFRIYKELIQLTFRDGRILL